MRLNPTTNQARLAAARVYPSPASPHRPAMPLPGSSDDAGVRDTYLAGSTQVRILFLYTPPTRPFPSKFLAAGGDHPRVGCCPLGSVLELPQHRPRLSCAGCLRSMAVSGCGGWDGSAIANKYLLYPDSPCARPARFYSFLNII